MAQQQRHSRLQHMLQRHPSLEVCVPSIEEAYALLKTSYEQGGQMLLCGNGGSASDSDHIAGELLKGFGSKRPLAAEWKNKLGEELFNGLQGSLPALPLANFHGLLTAFSNDCNPEHMYAQLVWGLGRKQDVLLAITTSGNSVNILHAVTVAKAKGMKVIALTGQTGGRIKEKVDIAICAPATWTPDIQEYHLPIYHVLCLMLEETFFQKVPK